MTVSTKVKESDLAWFNAGDWKEGWSVEPNDSINVAEFAKEYAKNPERWRQAFKFLANTDLKALDTGKYELDGKNLYISISEYTTKNVEDAKCEAHIKYVDIQYLICGEEQIGIAPIEDTKDATPYNEDKDIYFIAPDYEKYYPANPGRFFIFFPSDAHRPSVKLTDNIPVKKAVVKLKIN
ncbi:MAG: YhcH/YjgK/YiaL family protein [Prevotellaceae bacterium]|jgi:YhcH/YjgK/YiaL family protein|nr:YhcH/YjgK/YiaL family protein [Prevotellaceae bacterium]